jgi:hypothetical protein
MNERNNPRDDVSISELSKPKSVCEKTEKQHLTADNIKGYLIAERLLDNTELQSVMCPVVKTGIFHAPGCLLISGKRPEGHD